MAVKSSAPTGDPAEVPALGRKSADAAGLPVPGSGSEGFPLLDTATLDALVEELGTPDIAGNFARDYAGMWKQRQARLGACVEQEDVEAALDAVISLKVTSAMVGGSRLAHLAGLLEATVRRGDFQQATAQLALITVQGQWTVEELQRRYGLTSR